MQGFRILEHTADVGFEAFGASRPEVFRSAGRALMSLIVDLESVLPRGSANIETGASEPVSLLVNWLSEILYLQDTEGWLFTDFDILTLTDRSLSASGCGERFERGRHEIKLLVKAITYHQLLLEETVDGWRAQVYVDI